VPEGGRHRPHVNVVIHLEPDTRGGDATETAGGTGRGDSTDADHVAAAPDDGDGPETVEGGAGAGAGVGGGFRIAEAHTVEGHPIDRVTAGTLLCDSLLYRVLVSGKSAIIDYGRATRAVPPPLWNVLLLRDRHCRFKGCDRPGHWDHAHHVVWWEKGGATNLANLVCLCARHHHIVHRPG
jgi:hypothetical protein